MPAINPHLHFNGNAEEAFYFYQSVFGGSFERFVRYRDLPVMRDNFAESELNKIMHVALPIGESGMLIGSDVPEVLGRVSENENRSKIFIQADSREESDLLFNRLSDGGTVEYSMGDSPWGSYFGALRDRYGIEWMIEYRE